MASDCIPQLSLVINVLQFPKTVSDVIFSSKLKRLLRKQDSNIVDWLKIQWKFASDTKGYSENVRKLIYLLEDQTIDIYANLLHSYQYELISYDDFFRLSWIVSQVYYQDLLLLKKVNSTFHEWNHSSLFSLEPYGLFEKFTERHYNSDVLLSYALTALGNTLLNYGINVNEEDI